MSKEAYKLFFGTLANKNRLKIREFMSPKVVLFGSDYLKLWEALQS